VIQNNNKKIKKDICGMGQKRKHREPIPAEFTVWQIKRASSKSLLEIGRDVAGTDYAVRFYNNENHPKFYKNDDAVRKAINRAFAMGAFNHREQISEHFYSETDYLEYASLQPERRKETLLEIMESWKSDPCLICPRSWFCDVTIEAACLELQKAKENEEKQQKGA
jgi:hypothetical protein